jgi:hypothetical protein
MDRMKTRIVKQRLGRPKSGEHGGSYECEALKDEWRVLDRYCNYSTFNGRHRTPSEYSACKCLRCGFTWRTKADYVADLKDATTAERFQA